MKSRLTTAISDHKSISVIESILKDGIDIDQTNENGQTALMLAVIENNFEVAEFLLKNSCKVNLISKYSDSALSIAVNNLNYEMTKLLLNYNADIDYRGDNNCTLLHIAVFSICSDFEDDISILKLLIENGVKLKITDNDGETGFSIAKNNSRKDIMKILK